MRLLAFDCETTGVDPLEDRIVQLAMMRFEPIEPSESNGYRHFKIVSRFSAMYNPGRSIPAAATAQHGITDEDVRDKPAFEEDAGTVQEMVLPSNGEPAVLMGHNIRRFDSPLLDAELRRNGQPGLLKDGARIVHPEIDTWRVWVEQEPRTLEGALWRFRKERLENAHEADADTEAAVDVLDGMVSVWNLGLEDFINISQPDGEVDRAGKLKLDDEGHVCLAFGKHDGTPAEDVDVGYFQWMSKADFPDETMHILRRLHQQDYPKWEDLE